MVSSPSKSVRRQAFQLLAGFHGAPVAPRNAAAQRSTSEINSIFLHFVRKSKILDDSRGSITTYESLPFPSMENGVGPCIFVHSMVHRYGASLLLSLSSERTRRGAPAPSTAASRLLAAKKGSRQARRSRLNNGPSKKDYCPNMNIRPSPLYSSPSSHSNLMPRQTSGKL